MSEIFNAIQVPFQSTPNVMSAPVQEKIEMPKAQAPITVKKAIESSKVTNSNADTIEINKSRKKEGPIKSLKRGIANIKKVFATIGEYSKGIVKGALIGATAGCLTYGTASAINGIKSFVAAHSESKELPKLFKHHKAAAILVGSAIFIGNLWKASLNATDARSDIHDRYIGTNKK